MKIDVYCNDGSPVGIIPPDAYGRGLGGAELSLVSWAEVMAARGHSVRVYNDPGVPGDYAGSLWLPKRDFRPKEDREVFIVYRSPNTHLRIVKAGVKIHWSMDQYTVGNYSRDIFPFVDRIVCISPRHVAYHVKTYRADEGKICYIDLGVRVADYLEKPARVPGRCIFCSIPDRGLDILRQIWPKIIAQRPDASLVITGDYTLWGSKRPGNHQHRLAWLYMPNVLFHGNIVRAELVKEQLRAQVHAYPCTYDELFCISAAECQVAGAISVTPGTGALATTNEFGFLLPGNVTDQGWQRAFVTAVIGAMEASDKERETMQKLAVARFDWGQIAGQWERLIEGALLSKQTGKENSAGLIGRAAS